MCKKELMILAKKLAKNDTSWECALINAERILKLKESANKHKFAIKTDNPVGEIKDVIDNVYYGYAKDKGWTWEEVQKSILPKYYSVWGTEGRLYASFEEFHLLPTEGKFRVINCYLSGEYYLEIYQEY